MTNARWLGRTPPITRTGAAVAALWILTALGGVAMVANVIIASTGFTGLPLFLLIAVDALACTTMGGLIAIRRPGNRIGWLLALTGILLVVTFMGFGYGYTLTSRAGRDDLMAGLVTLIGIVAFHPLSASIGLLIILFPDGHLPSPRWRLPVGFTVGLMLATAAGLAVLPEWDPALARNPLGIDQPLVPAMGAFMERVPNFNFVVLMGLGVLAVAVRFRRARGDTREQLKWFLAAVTVVAVLAFPAGDSPWSEALTLISTASLALVPIAIAIAVLRYHLYAIDRILSRTLGWAIISATLVVTFAVLVVGLQGFLATVTDAATLPVAASTLVVAALFQPIRRRVQSAVDRRFDRARYDAARVVEAFAGRLRNELDLDALRSEIGRVAVETVRPASASVWLRPVRPAS